MPNPESEDYYQWTSYKKRMEAAIVRADVLQTQLREHQTILAAVVKKAGGAVRLEPKEYWNSSAIDRTGVIMKREPVPGAPPGMHGPFTIVLTLDESAAK